MTEDNSRFIVQAAKERHRRSVQRVLEVLRRFDRDGVPITFVGVAAAASVSRPWLYREPALRSEIMRCRSTTATPPTPLVPAAQRASTESQRQKIEALKEELRWFREDNGRLRSELERSLGEQRSAAAKRGSVATISSLSDMSPKQTI
ncbi:MAG: DUF6262 family protein [Acidimicrobiales bacterium]